MHGLNPDRVQARYEYSTSLSLTSLMIFCQYVVFVCSVLLVWASKWTWEALKLVV